MILIDYLFFIIGVLLKINLDYAVYGFVFFLFIAYKTKIIKENDKLFIGIATTLVTLLFLIAFKYVIIDYLYNINEHWIFYFSKYLYRAKFYIVIISLFLIYLRRKKYENYLLFIPLIGEQFRDMFFEVLLFTILVLLININYKKLFIFIKKYYLYIVSIVLFLLAFSLQTPIEYMFKISTNNLIFYLLLFVITILIIVYRNFQVTKVVNLLILESILIFAIAPSLTFYIAVILFYLITFKIFKSKDYIKQFTKQYFSLILAFVFIGISLIISYYLHNHNIKITIKNTYLFTTYKDPIEAYSSYFVYLMFLIAFVAEVKKVIYKQIVILFVLAIFISEIFSYMIIFNLDEILHFFKLIHYSMCDPAPFSNHITYSVLLALMLLLLIDMFLKNKNYFLLLFIITATLNLFLNGGRTGQLSFILAMLIYFWFYLKDLKKFIIFVFAFFSIIFLIFHIPTKCKNNLRLHKGADSFNKVIKYNSYTSSWGSRLAIDLAMLDYVINEPKVLLFGVGGKEDKATFMKFVNTKESKPIAEGVNYYYLSHLHNAFMQLLLDAGIIPVLLLLYVFYYLIKLKTNNEPLKFSLLIIAFIFLNQGVILFYSQEFMIVIYIIITILTFKKTFNGNIYAK